MKTQCPNCKQEYEVDDRFNNQTVKCSMCKQGFIAKPLWGEQGGASSLRKQKDEFSTLNRMMGMGKSTIQGNLASNDFKVPLIVQIIRGIGFFGIIATIIILFSAASELFGGAPQWAIPIVHRAFYVFLATTSAFALASIISYLAKIEHNTRKK